MSDSSRIMAIRRKLRPYSKFVLVTLCSVVILVVFIEYLNIPVHSGSDLPSSTNVKPARNLKPSIPRNNNKLHDPKVQIPRVTLLKEDILRQNANDSSVIPRIIHLTWKSKLFPSWTREFLLKWKSLNPGWQLWFWSDSAAEALIKTRFNYFHKMYKEYSGNIMRADVVRYFIIYEYGGFYADLDVEPIKSLEPLREQYACLLSTEPDAHARFVYKEKEILSLLNDRVACNAVMACRPKHSFFKYVIDMLPGARSGNNPVGSTGPLMLTIRYISFDYFVRMIIGKSPHRVLERVNTVFLAPDHWFLPSYDPNVQGLLTRECRKRNLTPNQRSVCDQILQAGFVNGPRESSYTNHLWEHSWIKGMNKHKQTTTFDISKVIPDVIFPDEQELI